VFKKDVKMRFFFFFSFSYLVDKEKNLILPGVDSFFFSSSLSE